MLYAFQGSRFQCAGIHGRIVPQPPYPQKLGVTMIVSPRCRKLLGTATAVAFFVLLSGCATDQVGNTPLIRAAWEGDADKVEALLKTGADVNASNREGMTALMASTWGKTGRGDVRIAKALMASGANVNAANVHGRTALMEVAGNGNSEFVLLLINAGADVNAQLRGGGTALHEAAINGHTDIVGTLLAKGARPNVANAQGLTPLMWACVCAGPRKTCPWRPDIVRLLIAAGADVNTKDARGETALSWATGGAKTERDEVKQLLRNAGATE
jgi:ankyrin repeat protein